MLGWRPSELVEWGEAVRGETPWCVQWRVWWDFWAYERDRTTLGRSLVVFCTGRRARTAGAVLFVRGRGFDDGWGALLVVPAMGVTYVLYIRPRLDVAQGLCIVVLLCVFGHVWLRLAFFSFFLSLSFCTFKVCYTGQLTGTFSQNKSSLCFPHECSSLLVFTRGEANTAW